jgi:hypothetical protein
MRSPVELTMPFDGLWTVQNSPARRVPSHGTHLFGGTYAIDFVGVDDRHRTATRRDWRTWLGTEPPERFVSFGRPILAPAHGVVVHTHDGETDHEARRSQIALVPYALGQAARARAGVPSIAGNHVVLALGGDGPFVVLAHLQAGSIHVATGDRVTTGQSLAACGNSGNSTQPHLHLQAMDGPDPTAAQGLPIVFRRFREWRRRAERSEVRSSAIPHEGSVVEPMS